MAVLGVQAGDADFDLTYVQYAVPLADGRIATFSPIGSPLLIFAASGRGQRVVGRPTAPSSAD